MSHREFRAHSRGSSGNIISSFPCNLLDTIFSFSCSSSMDLLRLGQVSSEWHAAATQSVLWRNIDLLLPRSATYIKSAGIFIPGFILIPAVSRSLPLAIEFWKINPLKLTNLRQAIVILKEPVDCIPELDATASLRVDTETIADEHWNHADHAVDEDMPLLGQQPSLLPFSANWEEVPSSQRSATCSTRADVIWARIHDPRAICAAYLATRRAIANHYMEYEWVADRLVQLGGQLKLVRFFQAKAPFYCWCIGVLSVLLATAMLYHPSIWNLQMGFFCMFVCIACLIVAPAIEYMVFKLSALILTLKRNPQSSYIYSSSWYHPSLLHLACLIGLIPVSVGLYGKLVISQYSSSLTLLSCTYWLATTLNASQLKHTSEMQRLARICHSASTFIPAVMLTSACIALDHPDFLPMRIVLRIWMVTSPPAVLFAAGNIGALRLALRSGHRGQALHDDFDLENSMNPRSLSCDPRNFYAIVRVQLYKTVAYIAPLCDLLSNILMLCIYVVCLSKAAWSPPKVCNVFYGPLILGSMVGCIAKVVTPKIAVFDGPEHL